MTVYIHDAVRTPRGKARPDGALAGETPHGLVTHLVDALCDRGRDARAIDRFTLGCVGQVGAQGGHIAMVAKMAAELPDSCVVHSVNNFCASGLTAIAQAADAIEAGQATSALAGGVEMMSRVPFMGDRADYYADRDFPPARRYIPVGLAADLLAQSEGISRRELDEVAERSQRLAAAAEDNAAFNASRIAVAGLDREEAIRPTTLEKLDALPPTFTAWGKEYAHALEGEPVHSHTVGHAPPIVDGAALALLSASGEGARARILSYAEMGSDPRASLTAGFAAMEKALERADLTLDQLDRIEFMEAFAVTYAKFLRDCPVDPAKVNVSGGHIAKGHPMGATGAILTSSLLDVLNADDGWLGMVVCTGAQGVGAAMIVERLG
ncbi:acetyl-CoA C-acyltransferase [Alteriqipengyuania lutimaris]|uniref:Acetyl-CoA C-acyltransferase n=1 Tax=Alteriqipengyuania lutimaris TaxID=1538146 RepID=A0A395LK47_9SPHN|nr:acetyl-CoA C-acyltransferase [Alteriqipengyuania lutimaris]MBB3033702.1 acetyl-CoA C-acetyltransferase/acetyl-CoA acyltransferase [Alteriqipengyuania lutimaris]RDS77312.1 acetyl-CoA C-acyltransferase [Alteriqipengyuania lutimaris]